ncbi:PEP-CTERM sorting domain-containing protein [Puniceicoccus vermicola]|uniref:PEP-CTERM sorting domain-containing protein n=1 Tax=Puniceicoccus vermicola TaxID=388746 RepID=A0A7X1AZP1_9BACT|nr:PEP-CTERM sorting domain-containing protein [Puniceicoccus vermicola]MBC2601888.1 PEP-CTERM sorting domain-containing protein [Puniceicoccus vermicola]
MEQPSDCFSSAENRPQLPSTGISYDTAGSTYTEDFDSGLPSGAATPEWNDGSAPPPGPTTPGPTFTGWYAYQTATSGAPTNYRITSSGNSTESHLYQWRSSASASDGALGTRPYSGTGDMMLGLNLVNNTGATLTEFTLGYTGEQWFESETAQSNQFVVSYQIGMVANLDSGSWTEIPDLEFTSLHNSGVAENLNGSLPQNQSVLSSVTVSDIVWAEGSELWIRWFHDDDTEAFDHGMAIDDVSFTAAVPEPEQFAGLLGLGSLAIAFLRRPRRSNKQLS